MNTIFSNFDCIMLTRLADKVEQSWLSWGSK